MEDIEYDLYRHKSIPNKWKVVRDGSVPDNYWCPVYHVKHKHDSSKVIYTTLN